MYKNVGDIILNPEKLNKIIYNSDSECKNVDLTDFDDQVYPHFLEKFVEDGLSGDFVPPATVLGDLNYDNEKEHFIVLLASYFYYVFEPAIRKKRSFFINAPKYDLSEYEKRKDLVGALARAGKNPRMEDSFVFVYELMALFLENGPIIKLRKFIPAKLAHSMTKLLQDLIIDAGNALKDTDLKNCAKKYKFLPAKDAVKNIAPLPEYIKILPADKNKVYMVLHNARFCEENKFFNNVLSSGRILQHLADGIIFDHCQFDSDFYVLYGKLKSRYLFRNCTFNGKFMIHCGVSNGYMKFEKCRFNSLFDIRGFAFYKQCTIEDCVFYGQEETKIEDCTVKKEYPGRLSIKNCTFYCPFSMQSTRVSGELHMENLAFFNTFNFTDFDYLPEKSVFSKLIFNRNAKTWEKVLIDVLKSHGQENVVRSLGLQEEQEKQEKESSLLDYDAYQVAYNSGFLKPEFAAYFLGKSKIFLQKKRTKDKKKISRDSLPFKIDGRDVQYPVEALLAYKAKDWDTLKNLRKKYPIPTE